MAISKETLDKIHELLASELVSRLEHGSVVRDKEGNLVEASVTAAELNVIRQFLKDNGIDRVPKSGAEDDALNRLINAAEQNIPAPLRRN